MTNLSANTTQPSLKTFKAEYSAYRFGRNLGKATLALSVKPDNLYQLDYSSKVSAFFLSDKRQETSVFSVENGQLIPKTYQYKRTGTGSDKQTSIEFTGSEIIINQGQPINWNGQFDNQLYRLDTQLKLAAGKKTISYDLVNSRGELRHYDLKILGAEQIELPYGKIEGIKIMLDRKNSSRETLAWFAPSLNYQLVKLQQFKDGDEQGEIRLKSFVFTDQ